MVKNIKFGSCQCGAVKLSVKTDKLVSYICHCLECKKQSASIFAISVPLVKDHVNITGHLGIYDRSAKSGAMTSCYFCLTCGSRIYHQSNRSPDMITLKGGVLDGVENLEPVAHLWVKRKAAWVQIPPEIETYDEQPVNLRVWRDGLLSKATQ